MKMRIVDQMVSGIFSGPSRVTGFCGHPRSKALLDDVGTAWTAAQVIKVRDSHKERCNRAPEGQKWLCQKAGREAPSLNICVK